MLSVVVQLSLLCVFKYAGWLSGEFNAIAASPGVGIAIAQFTLPLPPGTSFYTSYTADGAPRRGYVTASALSLVFATLS